MKDMPDRKRKVLEAIKKHEDAKAAALRFVLKEQELQYKAISYDHNEAKTKLIKEKGRVNSAKSRGKKKETDKDHFLKYWKEAKQKEPTKKDEILMDQYCKQYPSRKKSHRQLYRYLEKK